MASAGTSLTPSSRCMTPSASARMRSRSASGTPMSSEMTSIGSLPANSVDVVDDAGLGLLHHDVEVLDRDLGDAGLQLADPARGEALGHQRPQSQVVGIVHGQERHGLRRVRAARDRVERDALRLDSVVLLRKPGQHVGVPRQRPEAQFVVVVQRRLVAQALVVRIRIFVEVVVVRVEQHVGCGHRSSPRMRPTT